MWDSSALMGAGSGPQVKCSTQRKVSPDSALRKRKTLFFFEKTFGCLFKSPKLKAWRNYVFVIRTDEKGPNRPIHCFSCKNVADFTSHGLAILDNTGDGYWCPTHSSPSTVQERACSWLCSSMGCQPATLQFLRLLVMGLAWQRKPNMWKRVWRCHMT